MGLYTAVYRRTSFHKERDSEMAFYSFHTVRRRIIPLTSTTKESGEIVWGGRGKS